MTTGLQANPDIIWDVVDGRIVLCNLDSRAIFELNGPGSIIWANCPDLRANQMIECLRQAYPSQARDRLTRDVAEFIAALKSAGIVSPIEVVQESKCP
jgi:hypothetical protein